MSWKVTSSFLACNGKTLRWEINCDKDTVLETEWNVIIDDPLKSGESIVDIVAKDLKTDVH